MKKSILSAAIFCTVGATALPAYSETLQGNQDARIEVMQTGRYSLVKNIPPVDQLNPLKVVIKTRIPQSIKTVGETVDFLLVRSGYSLADQSVLSKEAKILLKHDLPQVHRVIGPMTLDQALHTLSGSAFELVVDPVLRKVAFELSANLGEVNDV